MAVGQEQANALRGALKQAVVKDRVMKRASVLHKEAGVPIARILKRLTAVAHPKVSNPKTLKWLKPFISSKTVRTGIHGTPEEVAAALEGAYSRAGMPATGFAGGASGSGSGGAPVSNLARLISEGAPYKDVTKNRLHLDRLAGVVGGTGAAGYGAYRLAKGPGKPQTDGRDPLSLFLTRLWENPQARNALIAAGVGGLGTMALSSGDVSTRVAKGLAGAAVAGGATYAYPYLQDAVRRIRERRGGEG